MRWTGQWPGTQQNQLSGDTSQQILGTLDDSQRTQQNQLMSMDHQLHQQIQQQLTVEQFQLLSHMQQVNAFFSHLL